MLGLVASASFQCTRGNVCVGRTGLATQVFGELQAAINRYLEALGVATIHVTGVIDPATANAITIVSKSYPDVFARMPPSISQHATATFTPQYVAEHADELFHALGMFAPRSTPKAAPANPVNQPRGGVAPSTSSTSPAVSKPKGGGFKPPGGTLKPPGGTLKPPPGTTPRPSTSPSASRNPATAPAPGPSSTDPTLAPSISVRSGHHASHWQPGGGCWCGKDYGFACYVCHSNVTDGQIVFHADCTHALAGRTVDLPDINP